MDCQDGPTVIRLVSILAQPSVWTIPLRTKNASVPVWERAYHPFSGRKEHRVTGLYDNRINARLSASTG